VRALTLSTEEGKHLEFHLRAHMLGFIRAKKFYKGRYGRIRLVAPNISKEKCIGCCTISLFFRQTE